MSSDLTTKIQPEKYVMDAYFDTVAHSNIIDTSCDDDKYHKRMMNLNFKWFMQTLLDRKDRMSMYSGLEVRVPFCDKRIAHYLYSVPWDMKEYGGYEKGLLRKAVEGLLPDEILWRKKSPYPKTHNPEYLTMVSSILSEIIASPNEPIFDIVDRNELVKLFDGDNSIPWYGQLMTIPQTMAYFIQMNYWLKKFMPEIIL